MVEARHLMNIQPEVGGLQGEECIRCAEIIFCRRVCALDANEIFPCHAADKERSIPGPDLVPFFDGLEDPGPEWLIARRIDIEPGLFVEAGWRPSRGLKE